jgi:hypothetical protein
MGWLRTVLLAGCLLVAACGGGGGTRWASTEDTDYKDFLRFGAVTYHVADHGVGRPVARGDLGPRFAVVRANPPDSDPTHRYRVRDGDAAFVPAGSPVFAVRGYDPSFRLAATHHGRLRLYEADAAVGARTGADLLDLAGKVRHLSVNSGRFELARIKSRPRVAELVGQVLAAPVAPPSGRAEHRHCFVVFNLHDGTAVRRAFFPATGELLPGVFAPPAFTGAVEGALEARQRTCGGTT